MLGVYRKALYLLLVMSGGLSAASYSTGFGTDSSAASTRSGSSAIVMNDRQSLSDSRYQYSYRQPNLALQQYDNYGPESHYYYFYQQARPGERYDYRPPLIYRYHSQDKDR